MKSYRNTHCIGLLLLLLPLAMRNARAVTLFEHCQATWQQNPYLSTAFVAMTGAAFYLHWTKSQKEAISNRVIEYIGVPLHSKEWGTWEVIIRTLFEHSKKVQRLVNNNWKGQGELISRVQFSANDTTHLYRNFFFPENGKKSLMLREMGAETTFSLTNENTLQIRTIPWNCRGLN